MLTPMQHRKPLTLYYKMVALMVVLCASIPYLSQMPNDEAEPIVLNVLTIAFLLIGLKKPFIFPLSFLLFSCFRLSELIPILDELSPTLFIGCASLIYLFSGLILKIFRPIWNHTLTFFYLFSAWLTLSCFFSVAFQNSMDFLSETFSKHMLGFYIVANTFYTQARIKALLICYMIMMPILSSMVIYNHRYNQAELIQGRSTIALDTSLADPNDSAFLLLALVGFCACILTARKRLNMASIWCLLSLAITMLAIGYTVSRGAIVGFLGIGFAFAWIYYIEQRIKVFIRYIPIMAMALVVVLFSGGIIERIQSSQNESGKLEASAEGRLMQWYTATKMTIKRPLFGVGPNAFVAATKMQGTGLNLVTHSSFFQILSNTGFIGCGLYYIMVFFVFLTCHCYIKKDHLCQRETIYTIFAKGLLTSTTGMFFAGLLLDQGFSWTFLLNCALSVNLHQLMKKENESLSKPITNHPKEHHHDQSH